MSDGVGGDPFEPAAADEFAAARLDLEPTTSTAFDPAAFEVSLDTTTFHGDDDPLGGIFAPAFGSALDDGANLADDLFDEVSPQHPTNLDFGFGAS